MGAMTRYAAKLLFQFRFVLDGDSGKMRTCEERIINFLAISPEKALRYATRAGRASEFDYHAGERERVFFQFIGVLDLMDFGAESSPEEVFYDIRTMKTPMERRAQIVPSEDRLLKRLGIKGKTRAAMCG